MLYRVVLPGHVVQGADVEHVGREFARVTGLPPRVTASLLNGTPSILKRHMAEADAERIAGTLRAIGAQATVEREPADPMVALGTPTVSPTSGPLPKRPPKPGARNNADDDAHDQAKALLAAAAQKRRKIALLSALVLVGVAVVAMPLLDDFGRQLRAASAPPVVATSAKPATAAAVPSEEAPAKPQAAHLVGPWRCTNQASGASQYWRYDASGALVFQGSVDFIHGEKPVTGPDVPTRWTLDGERVVWTYEARQPADTARHNLLQLSLVRYDYVDPNGDAVYCRRP